MLTLIVSFISRFQSLYLLRALPQKFWKKIKNTPMLILFRIVQGFQKYIWLVYQTSPEMGIFFKVDEGFTQISYRCARIEQLNQASYTITSICYSTRLKVFTPCIKNFYAQPSHKKSCQKLKGIRLGWATQFERTDMRFEWTPRQL